jgi:hypothetical protein
MRVDFTINGFLLMLSCGLAAVFGLAHAPFFNQIVALDTIQSYLVSILN